MAVDRTGRVFAGALEGKKGLESGDLARWVRNLAIDRARARVVTLALAPLTDSSGGTAGASMKAVDLPAAADTSIAGGLTPASLTTIIASFDDAYATLVERANLVRDPVGMGAIADGPGTPGGGTISLIGVSTSAASGNASASRSSVNAALAKQLDRQRTAQACVDEVRRAVGLVDTATESTSAVRQGAPNDDLLLPVGPAVAVVTAGTSATTGVLKTAVDAILVKLRDNVALMADQIDAAVAVTVAGRSIGVYAS